LYASIVFTFGLYSFLLLLESVSSLVAVLGLVVVVVEVVVLLFRSNNGMYSSWNADDRTVLFAKLLVAESISLANGIIIFEDSLLVGSGNVLDLNNLSNK